MKTVSNSIALVAGGTGYVGEGIVKSLLNRGARVVVPFRNSGKADSLRGAVPPALLDGLDLQHTVITDEASMDHLMSYVIETYGRLDMAVASLGGWYYGYSLHRMPLKDWQTLLTNNLNSHFMFMKPVMEYFYQVNDGEYVMINGSASEKPVPESGAISVLAGAQKMMGQVLREEAHGTRIQVSTLIPTQPLKTRERMVDNMDSWFSAEELGQLICEIIEESRPRNETGVYYL